MSDATLFYFVLCCMYRSIFIDLDDTVWAFTENARDTFQDMYDKYHFDRYFRSFSHFYTLYSGKNEELWNEYGAGRITKDELNDKNYQYIYQDIEDVRLVQTLKHLLFYIIDTKKGDLHHLQRCQIVRPSEYLEFDANTKRNLELVETLRNRERQFSLLWLLDKNKTAM